MQHVERPSAHILEREMFLSDGHCLPVICSGMATRDGYLCMSSSVFLGCKMGLFPPLSLSPRFWSQGHPGHSERPGDGDQGCTIIVPLSKGLNWNEVDCNQLNRWVCKGTLGTEEPQIHQTH